MKKLLLFTLLFLYSSSFIIFSQEVTSERHYPETPEYFIPKNHDPNFLKLTKLPSKSFYESKSDWQQIIDSYAGMIEVESDYGEGTIFRIYLPAEQRS